MAVFFKVKVDGKVYELDRLTLGDGRVLKRDFGLIDLETFSTTDPDQMVGLIALAISKTDGISLADATLQAEDIGFDDFEPQEVEDESDAPLDKTAKVVEGDDEVTAGLAKSGSSGKRQKKPGTPR